MGERHLVKVLSLLCQFGWCSEIEGTDGTMMNGCVVCVM